MKLDPSSRWRAELVAQGSARAYDTPRCAFTAWRRGTQASSIRVQEFYDRAWMDGDATRFVVGSDVLGPMGADLVPVDLARVDHYLQNHGGRALAASEITSAVAEDPR
jgi:copper chaperone NosL